jgi:rod shape-determining protein MreD
MSLVLAAVGSAVAALIQTTILSFTTAGGGGLDLVLILAVVWTMTVSFEGGLVWAFFGGLLIDVGLLRPLGLTAFVLLLAVGAAWLVGRFTPRATYLAVVGVAAIAAAVASAFVPILIGAMRNGAPEAPFSAFFGSLVIGAFAAAVLAPIPLMVRRRLGSEDGERPDW